MDDGGFTESLPVPDSIAGGLVLGLFVLLLIGLWVVVRRSRERHADDLRRRREGAHPPEPEDPTKLPGE